jgi:hypothetical protein
VTSPPNLKCVKMGTKGVPPDLFTHPILPATAHRLKRFESIQARTVRVSENTRTGRYQQIGHILDGARCLIGRMTRNNIESEQVRIKP